MKRFSSFLCVLVFTLALALVATPAHAGFIDFEDGTNRGVIASTITGLSFTNTAGFDWVYGDWRTDEYNGCYPNYDAANDWIWPRPLDTQYYSDGNFFGWMGAEQGIGVITFTASYATYFSIGYATASGLTLEAYDDTDTMLDFDIGVANNLGTGQLDYLLVEAPGMAYVTLYGTNNQWLADNLDTDAIQECTLDSQCVDLLYCNGIEGCNQGIYQCEDGEPVLCEDDEVFCNGEEACSETDEGCVHLGDPCPPNSTCNEETDTCDVEEDDDWVEDDDTNDSEDDFDDDTVVLNMPVDETEEDEEWPEGQITGGCCG
jgi:hypothetical protein